MKSHTQFLSFVALALAVGCDAVVQTVPAPNSPLPRGVFSGSASCPVRTTAPNGVQTTQDITAAVSFEISERGVPIVLGEEIAVGRSVTLQALTVRYTRIEATDEGLIIHSETRTDQNGVSAEGTALAQFRRIDDTSTEYSLTQTWADSQGYLYNQACNTVLSK